MADTNENSTLQAQDHREPAMTETDQPQPIRPAHVSFSIWPPTERTRGAVTTRLVETLSAPSILSKRYGTMAAEEAAEAAKRIEAEAFEAAGGAVAEGGDGGDGIEVLQVYSKEISKRMLEAVKARSAGAGVEVGAGVETGVSGGEEAGADGVEA